jgi:hypothetical protein
MIRWFATCKDCGSKEFLFETESKPRVFSVEGILLSKGFAKVPSAIEHTSYNYPCKSCGFIMEFIYTDQFRLEDELGNLVGHI